MFFVIGMLLWLIGMVGFGTGGRPQDFIDLASLGIVGVGMWGLLCIGHGRTVLIMKKALFSSSMTAEQLLESARAWRAGGWYAMWSGVVGAVIGWVMILRGTFINMDNSSQLGPPVAISIMTLLYGSMLLVLARAFADRIEGRAVELGGQRPAESASCC